LTKRKRKTKDMVGESEESFLDVLKMQSLKKEPSRP
jgi:hypothetical protein